MRRLLRLRGDRRRRAALASARASSASSRTASKLEFLRSTNNNSWGVGFSEEGIALRLDGQRQPERLPADPEPLLRGGPRLVADACCGGIAGNAPLHPDHRQGPAGRLARRLHRRRRPRALHRPHLPAGVLEPHRVRRASRPATSSPRSCFDRDGSDFRSRNAWNLLASDDEWTAPIMAEVGPDGNVWVHRLVQLHRPAQPDAAGLQDRQGHRLRDATCATRSTAASTASSTKDGASARAGSRSPDATPRRSWSRRSSNDNLFWRLHAQRLLVERGNKDVRAGARRRWSQDQSVDAIGLNAGAIHALWTLHGLGALDGSNPDATAAAVAALKHPSAGVRRNAVQVLPRTRSRSTRSWPPGCSARPGRRRSGWRRCWRWPSCRRSPQAGGAIAAVARRAGERRTTAGCPTPPPPPPRSTTRTSCRPSPAAKRAAPNGAERSSPSSPSTTPAAARSIRRCAARRARRDADPRLARGDPRRAGQGLAARQDRAEARRRRPRQALEPARSRSSPRRHAASCCRLAARWGSKRLRQAVRRRDRQDAARRGRRAKRSPTPSRLAAAEQAGRAPAARRRRSSRQLLDADHRRAPRRRWPPACSTRSPASERPDVGAMLVEAAARPDARRPRGRRCACCSAGPTRRARCSTAIEKGKVQLADLSLDQKQALAAHPDQQIAVAPAALLAARRRPAQPRPAEGHRGAAAARRRRRATPPTGKVVFKKHCAKCHTHSGEGHQDRPRPDRHGRPPEGGAARPHPRPEPQRRGQLPHLSRRHRRRPRPQRPARLRDARPPSS